MQTATTSKLLEDIPDFVWLDIEKLDNLDGFSEMSRRSRLRFLKELMGGLVSSLSEVVDHTGSKLNPVLMGQMETWLRKSRIKKGIIQFFPENKLLALADFRGHVDFYKLQEFKLQHIQQALEKIKGELLLIPHGNAQLILGEVELPAKIELIDFAHRPIPFIPKQRQRNPLGEDSHLWDLEQESIRIIREAVASAKRPGMLFSLGKDSMVMLRLAEKAFAPEPIPFPLVNIDTRWKFQEMNTFREWVKSRPDVETIHFINPDAVTHDTNPFDDGSAKHTDITKTQALRKVLEEYGFDFVFGGARRDEEKSRAKERIFSVRSSEHSWDPKNQRPELWDLYNTKLTNEQSMRVFPLSNWTELDIWKYLDKENIPLVPLYFAKTRPFVERNGSLIMVDDERFRLEKDEKIKFEKIRFRSLGCYPLSGGVVSKAKSVAEIVEELRATKVSERSSRVIDFDRGASMEQKKKVGYF